MTKAKSRIEVVTPERAKKYLGMVGVNRGKKLAAIDTYAKAMERGEWIGDGPPLFFSNGELIDGQNRLHAVIKADMPVSFRVVRGVDLKLKYALDTQSPRNFGDVLSMEGYLDCNNLAAVARLEWTYRQSPDMFRPGRRLPKATHFELLEIVRSTPQLIKVVKAASPWKKKMAGWCPTSTASWLLYQFQLRDRELGHQYWYEMANGINLAEQSPILKLRTWLISTSNKAGVTITRRYRLAVLIKCWNAFIKGLMMDKAVSWRQGGYNAEPFPEIESPAESVE